MAFSTRKAMNHIRKICKVSKHFPASRRATYSVINGHSTKKKREVIDFSRKRAEVFSGHMESLGLKISALELEWHRSFRGTKRRPRNYMVTYNGSNEEVWFTGHHDYIAGTGACDNASSLGIMMELARNVVDIKPKHTIRFASFDLEEYGLVGSYDFTSKFYGIRRIKALINMDCVGGGKHNLLYRRMGGTNSSRKLCNIIEDISSELGHDMRNFSTEHFTSDHIPLIEKGVKALEISCGNLDAAFVANGCIPHTSDDVPENLNVKHIRATGEILYHFIENLESYL